MSASMSRVVHGNPTPATRQDLARPVAYLKEESQVLRARRPERLVATDEENRRLLRFGKKLGQQLKELISIVTYQLFLRWVRKTAAAQTAKRGESPADPEHRTTSANCC
jgi:hypothetical protein